MRNISIEGKMEVFKTLDISRLVYLAFLTVIPNHMTEEVAEIQKSFVLVDSFPKIKHETLRIEFKVGGLNNVDIRFKFVCLLCSWVTKLYDDCFHEWKIIPLHLLIKYLALSSNSILTFILKQIFYCTSYNTFLHFKPVFMV